MNFFFFYRRLYNKKRGNFGKLTIHENSIAGIICHVSRCCSGGARSLGFRSRRRKRFRQPATAGKGGAMTQVALRFSFSAFPPPYPSPSKRRRFPALTASLLRRLCIARATSNTSPSGAKSRFSSTICFQSFIFRRHFECWTSVLDPAGAPFGRERSGGAPPRASRARAHGSGIPSRPCTHPQVPWNF